MFIIFNQEGEIEGYDKGFQFFVEQCFDEQKITSTSWINNIHKNDIHLFKKILKYKKQKNINELTTLYRIRTKKNIYCIHIRYSLVTSSRIDNYPNYAFIYPLCNEYLSGEKKITQYIPYLFTLTTQAGLGYLLVEKGKILFANDTATEFLELPENTNKTFLIKNFFPKVRLSSNINSKNYII